MADKVIEQEKIDEQPLPESVSWDTISDKPTSLADISIDDATTLATASTNATNAVAGLANKAIQGWSFDGVFSATGNNAIAWTGGTLRFSDGTSYTISSGSLSSIAALSYVYFNPTASTTAFQTTTSSANTVVANRLLVAVAKNVASGKLATYQAFGGAGGIGVMITADNIAANSITANEIQTNTITTLNLTAGSITGALIRTATSGRRIEMDTTNTNQIRFYDSTTLYGFLEANRTGSDGYINLLAQDEGAGLRIYTGVGASSFSAASLTGNGASIDVSGNASNSYATMSALNGGSFGIHGGPSGDEMISSGVTWSMDIEPTDDGSYNLGSSGLKWNTIYAYTISGLTSLTVSGSISTTTLSVGSASVPRIYSGYCSGTTLSKQNTSAFSVSSGGTGRYVFTHNWGSTNYTVFATAKVGTGSGAYSAKVSDLSADSFEITIFNDSGSSVASDFMFNVHRN